MSKDEKEFIAYIKRKNRTIIAKYFALYSEYGHLKKCMITLTPKDGKLSTTIDLRTKFFKKLRKLIGKGQVVKYFTNIEFTLNCSSHLHIQLFYNDKEPIEKAYKYITNLINNSNGNDISYAVDNTKTFTYVIKDYINTDIELEKWKYTQKVRYCTSSQKSINNKITRFLLSNLDFKTKNKYQELLTMIKNNTLVIKKGVIKKFPNRVIKFIRKIDNFTVIVFETKNRKGGTIAPLKIKRITKGRKIKVKNHYSLKHSKKLFRIYQSHINFLKKQT